MSRHYCPGEDCAYCQRRIEAIEYERDCPEPVDDYYDGT
ncbi:hypothetical protein SEA_MALTHUS_69 [Mycobacterium phage Malthus]|uniref:Uncharacterized protein n=3 Tax=Fionnbharthvirus TaxID=2948708 RepID=A0A6G6XST7_9CAUD|nr:hypothetical protein ACQ59_gp65 [Mycobacterium phage Fionnbharth]YP_009950410.1 hypothetical protein I5G69_gp67 [Mycobacterium phage Eponine]AVR77380.1 hypothetical protein SEA_SAMSCHEPPERS_66 [Mycobacterium phage SamScheppers]QGH80349.1 hypothetical protein SEA_MALTHUS_69 [Mycobacterium phage Malthus]QTF81676.1 hypothetical protein SEA_JULIETTE_70 [Mycobacterium phage Juliette]USH45347.1 hypothetical protein SEA_RUTHIEJR_69 [Mycobacterium phage Ruthiejr]WRQ08361.1 hypothetical protein JDB